MNNWLIILGMALATYATRALTLLALRAEIAPWLRRWLSYVPVAVFTALLLPPLLLRTQGEATVFTIGPALPAGIVGALVAWCTGNVLLTIVGGMLAYWALRWMGVAEFGV
jgi:branched-subunit amino acid transport protein